MDSGPLRTSRGIDQSRAEPIRWIRHPATAAQVRPAGMKRGRRCEGMA